jgi:hypothetical protein
MNKCKKCGNKFIPQKGLQNYCSLKCRNSHNIRKNETIFIKYVKCISCNCDIIVGKRTNPKKCKCKNCKIKYCKMCGAIKGQCKRPELCKKYKLISGLIKYFGFDKNVLGTEKYYEEFERIKNKLIEDYWDNEISIIELSKKYKHDNIGNFSKLLKSIGILSRTIRDGITLSYKNGNRHVQTEHFNYKCGYHNTWNNKQVFYRSSYELDYVIQLDELKIDYEMEKLRILYWDIQKLKQRVAIPDFYLPETNTIVEIKSTYTYNEQNMKDKLKAYKEHGYNFKLILDHKELILEI